MRRPARSMASDTFRLAQHAVHATRPALRCQPDRGADPRREGRRLLHRRSAVVRSGEVGSSRLIQERAARIAIPVVEHELETYFRCGGSEAFVGSVENTLELRRTPYVMLDPSEEFDFDVVDSPRELELIIRAKAEAGATARLSADFCWCWSDPMARSNRTSRSATGRCRGTPSPTPESSLSASPLPPVPSVARGPQPSLPEPFAHLVDDPLRISDRGFGLLARRRSIFVVGLVPRSKASAGSGRHPLPGLRHARPATRRPTARRRFSIEPRRSRGARPPRRGTRRSTHARWPARGTLPTPADAPRQGPHGPIHQIRPGPVTPLGAPRPARASASASDGSGSPRRSRAAR
jgi:hypothetical protein